MRDRDSSQVQYPRVLTRNNREVVIRSVLNQPVLASSSTVTQGVGGTTAASVGYLPIGTIINVLPKEMADGSIAMNVSISISNIVNEVRIGRDQDLYPVASTRVFYAALSVQSGYTVAIGGLQEARDQNVENGIPYLKDIPLLGQAFRSSDRRRANKNLIMFITPTLLPPAGVEGVAETPQSILPRRPGNEPRRPHLRQTAYSWADVELYQTPSAGSSTVRMCWRPRCSKGSPAIRRSMKFGRCLQSAICFSGRLIS